MDQSVHKHEVVVGLNPNLFHYFYCIQFTDFHTITVEGETVVFTAPRILCLKTYYPFHEFNFQLLKNILEHVRLQRIQIYIDLQANAVTKDIPPFELDSEIALNIYKEQVIEHVTH